MARSRTTGIYKITNNFNNKCYIGQSVNIERRFTDHKCRAFKEDDEGYNYPLYRAMRRYGLENFTFEILEKCKKEELDEKEIYYIEKYNSFYNGYNQTLGGDQPPSAVINQNIIQTKIDLETTNLTFKEIAEKNNLSPSSVYDINSGRAWKEERDYPIRMKYGRNYNSKLNNTESKPHRCIFCFSYPYSRFASICKKCYTGENHSITPNKDNLSILSDFYDIKQLSVIFNLSVEKVNQLLNEYNISIKEINNKKNENKRSKSKPNRKKAICPICGKNMSTDATKCLECFKLEQAKNIPSKEDLTQELLLYNMTKIGEKHDVTSKAVEKWCKKYDLPHTYHDIKEFRQKYKDHQECS